jgi:hypothetical protein
VIDMLFKNIVKKIRDHRLEGVGVATASPNGGCTVGTPYSSVSSTGDYLEGCR